MAVEDDGAGWTGEGEIKGSGLGTRIIRSMAKTAQAEVTYDRAHVGTRAVISVPV